MAFYRQNWITFFQTSSQTRSTLRIFNWINWQNSSWSWYMTKADESAIKADIIDQLYLSYWSKSAILLVSNTLKITDYALLHMSLSWRQLAIIMFLGASFHTLRAAPGANVPWITYEAENMTNNGGTIIGPPAQVADTNAVVANTIQMEASGGQAVELTGTGQYVELTAQAAANTIVVRYCVPDTADGAGADSTISLYQNGSFVQKLPVTSKYSWRYGSYPFSNTPSQGSPRNFFDEVRLNGLTINPGDTVRIEKDSDDSALYDVIDLVDLENVAAPLAAPLNSLSITSYGADTNGVNDSTSALQNCINAAKSQGKIAWIPAGTYLMTATINLPSNVTIQGAGMWYTTLLGDASQYNTSYNRVTLSGGGSNIHLSDFAILGKLNYRSDGDPNDGLFGTYGTGSTISRVWVEHTKVGARSEKCR